MAGLMLGTTTQVFAATGETTQNIPISSEIIATYQVTIPAVPSFELTDTVNSVSNTITLDNLTAAGAVSVEASVSDLVLVGTEQETALSNQRLTTTIAADAETPVKTSSFSLTNDDPTKSIEIATTEERKNNKPGKYTGTINFKLNYNEAAAADDLAE
ncbi:hypothetical protein [Carnobacterium inhibens]|nr:hypothetical protein [Carnobacterium inhibens]